MRTLIVWLCVSAAAVVLVVSLVVEPESSEVKLTAAQPTSRYIAKWPHYPSTTEAPQPVETEPEPTTRAKARSAPSHSSGGGSGGWECIRQKESGGDYSSRDPNGHYGAYQFDKETWASVGGSGNPADASPAEQDTRAQTLQSQRGWQPWTTASACGL